MRNGPLHTRDREGTTTRLRVLLSDRAADGGLHTRALFPHQYPSPGGHNIFDKEYSVLVEKMDFQTVAIEVLTKLGDRVPFPDSTKPLVAVLQNVGKFLPDRTAVNSKLQYFLKYICVSLSITVTYRDDILTVITYQEYSESLRNT